VIKRTSLILASSLTGFACGPFAATPFVAQMNFFADDGPIFPPPFVALLMLAFPIAVLVVPTQVIAVTFELLARTSIRRGRPWLALAAGSRPGSVDP
jgi:hypothetical protein